MNKRVKFVGYLLIVVGVAHAITGIVKYQQPLAAMLHEGYIDAVRPHSERLLAFWFMLFSAAPILVGQLMLHAAATGNAYLLRVAGWYLLIFGVIGVTALPKSPFWIVLVLAPFLLWSGYRAKPAA